MEVATMLRTSPGADVDLTSRTARSLGRAELVGRQELRLLLETCMQVCADRADGCERHARHMEHCRVCATTCRRCREACSRELERELERL